MDSGPATPPAAPRAQPRPRSDFRHFHRITTRWADNDAYGHVNNVVYYQWFDTAVNAYLMATGSLDIHTGPQIGLVVETQCHYFAPLAFPQEVEVGLVVEHAGTSSVCYGIGVFATTAEVSAAHGHFVHVYCDRATRRPQPLAPGLRAAIQAIAA